MRHAQEYPLQCGPLVVHQPLNDVSIAEAQAGAAPPIGPPIVALAYHGSASQLAVATVDHVVKTVKLPVSKYKRSTAGVMEPLGEAFVGHTGRLHSVCYSHDGGLLLSASADRSARIWRIGGQPPQEVLLWWPLTRSLKCFAFLTSEGTEGGLGTQSTKAKCAAPNFFTSTDLCC